MPALIVRGPRFNLGQGMFFHLQIYYRLYMEHLLAVVSLALLMTFCFAHGQSMFLQCYSITLSKRLISGSVYDGWYPLDISGLWVWFSLDGRCADLK